MTIAALGHVLAASVKTVAAIKPTTYKLRIADLPEDAVARQHTHSPIHMLAESGVTCRSDIAAPKGLASSTQLC